MDSILPDQARQHRTRIIDRGEPVKCPYNNAHPATRHPGGLTARTCPACTARKRWAEAVRRERIKTGEHIPNPAAYPNQPDQINPELRKPVPKCGLRHSTKEAKKECKRCRARKHFTEALRRDARRAGQGLVGLVDAAEVVQHVTEVLKPSGMSLTKIADRAGVELTVISNAIRLRHRRIHSINAAAILSVQPQPYHQQGLGSSINATGTRRILRGLYAQGWLCGYMAGLVGVSSSAFWHWIAGATHNRPREFVQPEMAEAAKRLRDKLGPFDIAELDEPMDGMSRLAAQRAAKRGWRVLADWDGLDIDDPRVTPHGHDDTLHASNGLVLVDPSKVELALTFRTAEADDGTLTTGRFSLPLTKMELYEIIRAGSERDHTGGPRFSANLLAQRLGTVERTVIRIRADLARADRVLDAAPAVTVAAVAAALVLSTAEWPAVLRMRAVTGLLAPYPIGRGFYRNLVVLGATQPRPYGRGWTDECLADWLGCTVKAAAALRSRAVLAGRQYHAFPGDGSTGRARNLGVEYPPAIT